MKNVYRQIMHYKKDLTKLEVIAADYFLQSNQPLHLRELAEKIHLSPATISRFVRKINFEDYDQFYEAYCQTLDEAGSKDKVDIKNSHLSIVEENHKLFDKCDMNLIAEQLIGRRVLIVAKEDTTFACMDFVNRLKRIKIDAHIATSKQDMILASSFLTEGDVVIAVSISGYNTQINDFLKSIQDKELFTIGVSTQLSSMIASCNQSIELYLETESIMSLNYSYSLPLILLFDKIYALVQSMLSNELLNKKHQTTNKIIS